MCVHHPYIPRTLLDPDTAVKLSMKLFMYYSALLCILLSEHVSFAFSIRPLSITCYYLEGNRERD